MSLIEDGAFNEIEKKSKNSVNVDSRNHFMGYYPEEVPHNLFIWKFYDERGFISIITRF